MALDSSAIRRDFPFLSPPDSVVRAGPADGRAVAFDNAATTQKPHAVLDAMRAFEETAMGNVHRGQHQETERATTAYEGARVKVQSFINARHADEIIFTKNGTEAINLVAHTWAKANMKRGDCIMLSIAEHHSNIIPWQQRMQEIGGALAWIDVTNEGELDRENLKRALDTHSIKLVALTGQSNVLGTRFDLASLIPMIHEAGAKVLIDAAQLIVHEPIDVQALDCDFLTFSGHKLYGPTGIGVLYAKRDEMRDVPAFLGGGGMVQEVTREGFVPADAPARFEAGTPPITQAVGLAAAIDWLGQFDVNDRLKHEQSLMKYTMNELAKIPGLTFVGPSDPAMRHGIISFVIEGVHAHDLTDLLGQRGCALRAGHHCAQPLHDFLGISASARISFAIYNTTEEVGALLKAMKEVIDLLTK